MESKELLKICNVPDREPIFDQLVALMKDVNSAMKDIKQIIDDLHPGNIDSDEEIETKNP